MENGAKRAAVLTALTSQNSREWTVGAGASRLTITLEQIGSRVIRGSEVLSADVIVRNRSGIIVYYDRVNMPNPPTATRVNGNIVNAPLDAFISTIKDTAKSATDNFTKVRIEKLSPNVFRGDTLSVRSATADGFVQDADTTWASTQNGPGESTTTTGNMLVAAWQLTSSSWIIRQVFIDWDTISLGSTAIVSDFDFTFYADAAGVGDTDGYNLKVFIYDWGGTLENADFRDCSPSTNITNLTEMASMAVSAWNDTANAGNTPTSTANVSGINKTGSTRVLVILDGAYNSTPSGSNQITMRSADEAGTDYDPLLVVTYTLPKAFPFRSRSKTRSQLRR